MNAFQRRAALRIFGIHVGVVAVIMIMSGLKGCFRPKPKQEIVTMIEFGEPAPPVAVQEVARMPDPEPPAPDPTPAPVEPAPVPEPVKPTIPKPRPKTETPKPKPKEPEKPKWKPTNPSDIKIGKKVEPVKKEPVLTQKDLDRLKNVQSTESLPSAKPTDNPGNPSEIAAYDAVIYSAFYNRWDRSSLSPTARPAAVTVSISASGRILSARLSGSSGDSRFDAAVMSAVRSVSMLPKAPPRGYGLNNIKINFTITN